MQPGLSSILVSNQNVLGIFLSLILVAPLAAESELPRPSSSAQTAPLTVNQVVDNLVRKDAERAQALHHYESTRVYRLSYHGFPGDREAEMTVEASFDRPSSKNF